jgi:hypothetical protein
MYSSFLEEGIVFDQSVSGKAIVNSDCEGQICCPSLDRESSQKREDSLPKIRNVMKRIAIYALVVGLIFPFTQVAQGQQAGPVQPPPSPGKGQLAHSNCQIAERWSMALRWRLPCPEILPALKPSPLTWKSGSLKIQWCDSVTCQCFARASL